MNSFVIGIGQLLATVGERQFVSGDAAQPVDQQHWGAVDDRSAMMRAMEEAIHERKLQVPTGPRVVKVPRPRSSASAFGRRRNGLVS